MIYIFDIDGVLADDSLTRDLDCTREKDRAEFTRLVPTLAPRPDAVRMAKVLGQKHRIFLFTARSAAVRVLTQNWLYDYEIPHEDLYMRPFGNDESAAKLKKKMLLDLFVRTGAEPQDLSAFDDNPDVRAMYDRWGVCAWPL